MQNLRTRRRRHDRPHPRHHDERGDVPGWVLITIMTISIGVALWGIAQPQLVGILQSALNSVK
ncbi:hypothetical protein FHP29_16450 [Nocardioides albidus]|uniref:Uncharacterized protein n=1 Tax=Nocardioides albidus TaxID=1517589 RepID=A0A5C4VNP3_9ACTN|nr:hypothetical protein [Nocardioides albidus]TNM37421.1 hypothetical protein FHP29_16450 [Nocardioides albidus]